MRWRRKRERPQDGDTQQFPDIAEKVRFWEEQDRINQTLIPRVIRQHELLTKHIEEHDNLPELFGRQLADALAEQSRRFEKEQRENLHNQSELFRRELRAAREEQSRRFETERKDLHNQYGANARHRNLLFPWLAIGAFLVSLMAIIVSLWA